MLRDDDKRELHMTVLFVGRLNDHWKQMAAWTEELGGKALDAPNALQGVKLLERTPDVEVVVVDADSCEENGVKLVRQLRENPRLAAIPLIVAGSAFEFATVQDLQKLGVEHILILPTRADTFKAKLTHAYAHGRRTVLIADDEQVIRDLLTKFFHLERYNTITACDGEEALLLLQERDISLVVSDIMMPNMNGLDLLIEVKRSFPWVPIILITGASMKYSPAQVIAMGADGYFSKPFNNLELMYEVRQVMQKYAGLATALKYPCPGSENYEGQTESQEQA